MVSQVREHHELLQADAQKLLGAAAVDEPREAASAARSSPGAETIPFGAIIAVPMIITNIVMILESLTIIAIVT